MQQVGRTTKQPTLPVSHHMVNTMSVYVLPNEKTWCRCFKL